MQIVPLAQNRILFHPWGPESPTVVEGGRMEACEGFRRLRGPQVPAQYRVTSRVERAFVTPRSLRVEVHVRSISR